LTKEDEQKLSKYFKNKKKAQLNASKEKRKAKFSIEKV
jgi:hypothetical protein